MMAVSLINRFWILASALLIELDQSDRCFGRSYIRKLFMSYNGCEIWLQLLWQNP